MSFQRFWLSQTSTLASKKNGVFRWGATILLGWSLTIAFSQSAVGQSRFFSPRVANDRRPTRSIDVAPTETSAATPTRGIPARLDSVNAPQNNGSASFANVGNGNAEAGGRVDANGSATSFDESRGVVQTFSAPESVPSAGLGLRIERRASLKEAELETAPVGGYLAIVPRVNFLKKEKEEDARSDGDKRRGGGVDARISTANSTNLANANGVSNGSGASFGTTQTAANVPNVANSNANAVATPANENEVVVFTLNGLQPDEIRLLRDAEDGRWDEVDLFGAALIAEGLTTSERRAPYRAKYDRLSAQLAATLSRTNDPMKKTETIYTFLHNNVLTAQYNLNCSSLVASLDSGVFNCVSATTLFNCFAERSGLKVAALETTGHAKSRVKFEDSFLDLETTCSSWSRLPDKLRPYSRSVAVARPIQASVGLAPAVASSAAKISSENYSSNAPADATTFGAKRNAAATSSDEIGSTTFDPKTFQESGDAPVGYSYTKNRRPMREIGEVELVATIYYNVGVDFYQNERYEEAIAAYVKAARLAPNNLTILGNLKATLNNWAIQIAMKEKDFERAIQITEQGMLLDPDFTEYKMNLPIFFQHWTTYLAKDDKWDEVARVEKEYRKRFPKTTTR